MKPCCCDLQTGCKVLAIFYLISTAMMIIYTMTMIAVAEKTMAAFHSTNEPYCAYIRRTEGEHPPDEPRQDDLYCDAALLRHNIVACAYYVPSLVLSGILFIGAINRSAKACRVWLFGNPILYGAFLIDSIVRFATGVHQYLGGYTALVSVIMIGVTFHLYVFWVVLSFVNEIKRAQGRPQVEVIVPPQYSHSQSINLFPEGITTPEQTKQVIQYGAIGDAERPQQIQQIPSHY